MSSSSHVQLSLCVCSVSPCALLPCFDSRCSTRPTLIATFSRCRADEARAGGHARRWRRQRDGGRAPNRETDSSSQERSAAWLAQQAWVAQYEEATRLEQDRRAAKAHDVIFPTRPTPARATRKRPIFGTPRSGPAPSLRGTGAPLCM